ncbi:MAG: hypothetical protein KF819_25515 [Labilithrix sp.]|nr:hypothetical protein [Labilithrix sp.]
MGKVGFSLVVLSALSAVACARPVVVEGARVAAARSPVASDATPVSATLATAIGGEQRHEEKAEEAPSVPTTCGAEATLKDLKLCLPQDAYAKKLCGGVYPEVALGLFGKGTPWTRVYLAGDVEAWNATSGARLTHRAKLAFDEEVIVLGKHGAPAGGGVVMTGVQPSYDVVRWDGTCVSVMEGELTTKKPPAPKPAEVPWSRLEETTRRALLASPKVKSAYEALGKACSSVSTPAEKKSCEKADKAFTQAIVDVVRAGATLPAPARRP